MALTQQRYPLTVIRNSKLITKIVFEMRLYFLYDIRYIFPIKKVLRIRIIIFSQDIENRCGNHI
jgi:hypothetical protein